MPPPLFEPECRQDALNSPEWFPWHRPLPHLDCSSADPGCSLVATQGNKAAIRAATKEDR
jgi:hypothetical protein